MTVLGLNYYFHDSSACLIRDGKVLYALEEERLNRQKHTQEFPRLAAKRCIEESGLSHTDIDYIAVSIKPRHNWGKVFQFVLSNLISMIRSGNLLRFVAYHLGHTYLMQRNFWAWYYDIWGSFE